MGWRYRKSINLGLGFRINLSKSGIGYSWGFPGYRVTKMANGGNRTTYSIPGTGISYVEQNGKNSRNLSRNDGLYTGEVESFENIPVEEIEKNDPILKKVNRAVWFNRLANVLLFLTLLVYYDPIFSLSLILGIAIKVLIATTMKIKLYYEFDEESRKMYDSLKEVLIILSNNKKVWQIRTATRVFNTKYNAGAGRNVERNSAFVTNKLPWFIKTNIDVYGLNIKNQKMFFTPDRLIIFKRFGKVFGCTYNDMYLGIKTTQFVESERVYRDVEIINYTWRYANRDGGRDLRFSGNKKFPICKYGELTIQSPKGINTVLNFSNHCLSDGIQSNLLLFGSQFNKILARSKGLGENVVESKKEVLEKEIIPSTQHLKENIDEKIENKNINKKEIVEVVNSDYHLPNISILSDEESKSITPYIEKMKNKIGVHVPIGLYNDDAVLETIGDMPNLLIGGTVMSGKTSYINTIISSILLSKKPSEAKLIIFDSKKVDYSIYNGVPHLVCPVISDPMKLTIALKNLSIEIQSRTDKLRNANIKNIDIYNDKMDDNMKYPDIIVIIDDFSTLNGFEYFEYINNSVEYITSNGWNVNVYMIISANHPSASIIPTVSKENFPARLSFKVASSQSSKIILDAVGAEKLSGYGMALYTSRLNESIIKIKVPYITDNDISKIVEYCRNEQPAVYSNGFLNSVREIESQNSTSEYTEPLYDEIVDFVIELGKASTSLLQRRFRLGYNRAARAIDLLEEKGIVGPPNGSAPREVLVKYREK